MPLPLRINRPLRASLYTAPVQVIDHLFVLLFVVAYPLAGTAGFRRLLRRIAAGHPVDRMRVYRNTMIGHWVLLLIALLLWQGAGRPWAMVGLHPSIDWRLLAGLAIVLAAIALLIRQLRQLADADGATVARLHRRFGRLAAIVPRSRAELQRFYGVSLTAGVVEEVLWRGFLIWYFTNFWSLGVAAVAATTAFAVAHAYQGWRQVPSIVSVGAVLTALYLFTGSLLASIALHVAIDVLQGTLAFEIDRRNRFLNGVAVHP